MVNLGFKTKIPRKRDTKRWTRLYQCWLLNEPYGKSRFTQHETRDKRLCAGDLTNSDWRRYIQAVRYQKIEPLKQLDSNPLVNPWQWVLHHDVDK